MKIFLFAFLLFPLTSNAQPAVLPAEQHVEIYVEPTLTPKPEILFEYAAARPIREGSTPYEYVVSPNNQIAFAKIGFEHPTAELLPFIFRVPVLRRSSGPVRIYFLARRAFPSDAAENEAILSWDKDSPSALVSLRDRQIRFQELAMVSSKRRERISLDHRDIGLHDVKVMYRFVELGIVLLKSGDIALKKHSTDELLQIARTLKSIASENPKLFTNATQQDAVSADKLAERVSRAELYFLQSEWKKLRGSSPVNSEACAQYWRFTSILESEYRDNVAALSMPESLLIQCAIESGHNRVQIDSAVRPALLEWLRGMRTRSNDHSLDKWYNDLFR